MKVPEGFWAKSWSFVLFFPFFIGLLLLGIIKGSLLAPTICIIMGVGNSAVIIGLWPAHVAWTLFCIARTKQLGPFLKILLLVVISVALVQWLVLGIAGSILAGLAYGFLAPLIATFEAVGEGKSDEFSHSIVDGTWTTVEGSFTAVRDFTDVCFHSYFSIMDDVRSQPPPNGIPYEIRVFHLLGGLIVGLLGIIIDIPVITLIALYKSPFMLFKGWRQLFHDLIGREGPFLETACVPFAGLAILLWPVAVFGSVVASILSCFALGGYGAVVTYQESSIYMGLSYIVSSISIFDEYSNDILDMSEGSCFPRLRYRKHLSVYSGPLSRPPLVHQGRQTQKTAPSRSGSFKNAILELKPIKLLEHLFMACKRHGQNLVAEGVITSKDIDECLSSKEGAKIISIGLPAYAILQVLLRSIEANSDGLILNENTEITIANRPKDKFFEWFLDPLIVIKEQIKVENLSPEEENYFSKLVLLLGDPKRLKVLNLNPVVQDERRRAEINAFARRLQGITKSISRYPTAKRRFNSLAKTLSEELARNMVGLQSESENQSSHRSRDNNLGRLRSQKSARSSELNLEPEDEIQSLNV